MLIPKHIKIITFIIIFLGLCALRTVPLVPPPVIILACLPLLPAWFVMERRDFPRSYYVVWTTLAFLFIAGSLIEMLLANRSPLMVLPLQMIVLQLSRVFTIRTKRSLFEIWLISMAMVIISALVSYSLVLFVLLILFFAFTIMFLLEMSFIDKTASVRKAPLKLSAFICLVAYLLTAVIFLVLPRSETIRPEYGISSTKLSHTPLIKTAGFTTSFYLGSLRLMLQDDTEVMQIRLEQPVPGGIIYLRGDALDEFDGLSWRKSTTAARSTIISHPESSNTVFLTQAAENAVPFNLTNCIKYQLHYTQLFTNVIFNIPPLVALESDLKTGIRTDSNHGLRLMVNKISTDLTLYTLPIKSPQVPVFPAGQEEPFAEYLLLPMLPYMSKIEDLAYEITGSCNTDWEKGNAIVNYLRSNYNYSLRPTGAVGKHALEWFLFESRTGHCEFYATAMAILLRTLGIPSRVAVGYMVELPESFRQFVPIKNRQAHVWVEAYCDQQGWFQFDPTPPSPLPGVSQHILITKLLRWWEEISSQARQYLGEYGVYIHQRLFYKNLKYLKDHFSRLTSSSVGRQLKERLLQNVTQPQMIYTVLIIIFVDLILIWLYLKIKARWLRNKKGMRRISRQPLSPEFIKLYKRICKWLKIKPGTNLSYLTLKEMVTVQQKNNRQSHPHALRVIELYYAARFGSHADIKSIERQILMLIKASPIS